MPTLGPIPAHRVAHESGLPFGAWQIIRSARSAGGLVIEAMERRKREPRKERGAAGLLVRGEAAVYEVNRLVGPITFVCDAHLPADFC